MPKEKYERLGREFDSFYAEFPPYESENSPQKFRAKWEKALKNEGVTEDDWLDTITAMLDEKEKARKDKS